MDVKIILKNHIIKLVEHISSDFSMSTISPFKDIEKCLMKREVKIAWKNLQ